MTEEEFIAKIDCAFPYGDEAAAWKIIREAWQISANACFMVGEELARPPRSAAAPADLRLRLLEMLRNGFEHPIRDTVLDVAVAQIAGRNLLVEEALAALQQVAPHRGQYCAMNIVYFSCGDVGDQVEAEHARIRTLWEAPDE